MNLPNKLLLRRGDILAAGVSRHELEKLIECKVLTPVHLRKNTRAYFRRSQVVAVLEGRNQGGKNDSQ